MLAWRHLLGCRSTRPLIDEGYRVWCRISSRATMRERAWTSSTPLGKQRRAGWGRIGRGRRRRTGTDSWKTGRAFCVRDASGERLEEEERMKVSQGVVESQERGKEGINRERVEMGEAKRRRGRQQSHRKGWSGTPGGNRTRELRDAKRGRRPCTRHAV